MRLRQLRDRTCVALKEDGFDSTSEWATIHQRVGDSGVMGVIALAVEKTQLPCIWAKNDAPGCSINVVLEVGIHLPSFETAKNRLFQQPLPITTETSRIAPKPKASLLLLWLGSVLL